MVQFYVVCQWLFYIIKIALSFIFMWFHRNLHITQSLQSECIIIVIMATVVVYLHVCKIWHASVYSLHLLSMKLFDV